MKENIRKILEGEEYFCNKRKTNQRNYLQDHSVGKPSAKVNKTLDYGQSNKRPSY
mgnify:CR=1 FL=1